MYQRAVEGYEKALGLEHISTLSTVSNLGLLFQVQGKLEDAAAMYQRALEGYEKALGAAMATYVPYLNTLENYGNLCHGTRRLQDAASFYRMALNGIGIDFGRDSDRYARISKRVQKLCNVSSQIPPQTIFQRTKRFLRLTK